MFANITQYQQISHKKHSVSGKLSGFSPLVGNDSAVSTALNPLAGRGVWLPLFGDMVVWGLFLGNVRFVPML